MDWAIRLRADLAEPEVPTSRNELPFLAVSAVAIVVTAQLTDPGSVANLVLAVPAVSAFLVRALVPGLPAEAFAAVVVGSVAATVGLDANLEGALFLPVIMVLYVAWHLGSRLRAGLILVVSAAAPWVIAEVVVPGSGITWTPWTSASLFTFVLGRTLHRQQGLIRQLERARQALAEQAVADERRRIARELHDLAGHTLAAVLLHVTGARHVLRRDPDEAERALADAEAVGRSSLDQIRATVAALRTSERGTDRSVAGSAEVTELVEEYRRAGLVVAWASPAPLTGLDDAVGTALHRIAREALANVARHAPGNRVELAVEVTQGAVHLLVVDRGRAGSPPSPDEGRFGLVGMGERARALGGTLEAGPTPDGWRVEAWLPATITSPGRRVPS